MDLTAVDEALRYQRAWRDYKIRRLWAVLTFFGYPVGVLVPHALISRLRGHGLSSAEAMPLALTFMALFGVSGFRLALWKCPRCARPFFWAFWSNPYARKCLHCGLPKWATGADAEAVKNRK